MKEILNDGEITVNGTNWKINKIKWWERTGNCSDVSEISIKRTVPSAIIISHLTAGFPFGVNCCPVIFFFFFPRTVGRGVANSTLYNASTYL